MFIRVSLPLPLRSPGLPDYSAARETRGAVLHLTRRRRAPAGVGRATRAHHGAGLVGARAHTRHRARERRGPFAAVVGAWPGLTQRHALVIDGRARAEALGVL